MVKNNPLVTIVIPVYNASKYMKEAIDSALNQTYKNIEIIVVNDGSKDNGETEKIAKSYGERIKYFAKENGGVSTALNLAIKNMKGNYFSWLSHDDVYYLDKIENQIKYLEKNNLFNTRTIIYSDYDLINEKSTIISNCTKNTYMLNKKPLYGVLRGAINGITLLIPAKAFKDCGLFDETKRCTQDYELWWKMMKKYNFIHVPETTAKSRTHANQESNVNPRVLSEGEPMWIGFFESLTDDQIIKLEGSKYEFFKEMARFLFDTPYKKATEYCLEKEQKELKRVEKTSLKEKVSVIIPFYNRVDDCVKALKTVLNQTYINTEIILVNDGSTEEINKLEKVVKANKNCQILILDKNHGAAYARNMGIKKATGDYIAFLDSDDEFTKDKIEKQLKMMLLTNANFSHTSYTRNDSSGSKEIVESGKQSGEIVDTLIYSCHIATPTVMIKRSFLIKEKLFFDPSLVIGEDTCYWLSIAKKARVLGINQPLTIVNTNSNSAAYNIKKQILGLKTILRFVLNDEYLSKFEKSVAILSKNYSNYVFGCLNEASISYSNNEYLEDYYGVLKSKSWRVTKPLRLISKLLRSLKNYGIKKTMKKVIMYFKNRSQRK